MYSQNENGSYKLSMENSEFPGEVLSIDLNITVIDDGTFVNCLQQNDNALACS